jgi:hypothetical protein
MSFGQIARGINDMAVYPLEALDAPGDIVDVAGARNLEWSTEADTDQIEGDDVILGVSVSAKRGSGSMQYAKQNLTALAAMLGLTATTSGTTPNQITTLDEPGDANQTYIEIRAQALSVDKSGSAFEVNIHKAKVSGTQESLEVNAWSIPNISFEFLEDADGDFITRKMMETRAALA